MTVEKLDDVRAKRIKVVEEVLTIEQLELKKLQCQANIQRLQAGIDMWQAKVDAIDAEIQQIRALGVKTQAEFIAEQSQNPQGGEAEGGELP